MPKKSRIQSYFIYLFCYYNFIESNFIVLLYVSVLDLVTLLKYINSKIFTTSVDFASGSF